MTEANIVENSNDIISQINYEETNPVYQRIKKEFTDKLKDKYECTDYDVIVNYVFDFVFKKKLDKAKCIEKLDPYFNNKAADIVNYLWKITKEFEEDERAENMRQNYNYRKGGKPYNDKYRSLKQRFNKGKRERSRSRSDSRNRDEKNSKYENYPMQPKGYYPPKRYMANPIMGMRGGFPPYYQPPQMIPNYR